MDDMNKEDKQSTPRNRGPQYTKAEINALLNLIEKYKVFILNKAITGAASHAKELAWMRIARHFNNQNLGHTRSPDTLRTKWENLKRDTRRLSKNILETSSSDLDEVNEKIISLLATSEDIGVIDIPQELSEDEMDGVENESADQKRPSSGFPKYWNEIIESDGGEDSNDKIRKSRSQNFSPRECKLLLQCVRKEKKYVFSKEVTSKAIDLKNQAWSRITQTYNSMSPQKRSVKMLRTKFMAMKKMAKKVGSKVPNLRDFNGKHEKLLNDFHNIKEEPSFEDRLDTDSEHYSETDDTNFNGQDEIQKIYPIPIADPLSSVLNGDSGIGSSSSNMTWNWNQSENKEAVKLKLELLNYQLETAKLERKRLEERIKEEEAERAAKETERALRLRAARLDAIAASRRLPPEHPALHFPPQETPAHAYLAHTHSQFHHAPI